MMMPRQRLDGKPLETTGLFAQAERGRVSPSSETPPETPYSPRFVYAPPFPSQRRHRRCSQGLSIAGVYLFCSACLPASTPETDNQKTCIPPKSASVCLSIGPLPVASLVLSVLSARQIKPSPCLTEGCFCSDQLFYECISAAYPQGCPTLSSHYAVSSDRLTMDGIFDLELDEPGSSSDQKHHDFEEGNYSDRENHDDVFVDVETIDEDVKPATTSSLYEEIPFSKFTDKFPPNRMTIDHFELMKVLGRGGYGKVMRVRKKSGADKDTIYAMKVLKKAILAKSSKDIEHAKAERNVLELADHPFICQLFYAFQTTEKLYLILEYMHGGELYMLLERENRMEDDEARFYVVEILLALEHLHLHGIIYRDLKPENVALTGDGHVRLIDFGLCKEDMWDGDKAHTYCGTLEYIAPEVILKQGHSYTADWWSLATLLFDMLTGGPPFRGDDRVATQESILRKHPKFPRYIKPTTQNLLYSMLKKKPEKRLGYEGAWEIKEHDFFSGVDWDEALEQKLTPPFLPTTDESQKFDPEVLCLPAVDSPCSSIPGSPAANAFFGFSYGGDGFAHPSKRTESSASDTTTTSTPSTTN